QARETRLAVGLHLRARRPRPAGRQTQGRPRRGGLLAGALGIGGGAPDGDRKEGREQPHPPSRSVPHAHRRISCRAFFGRARDSEVASSKLRSRPLPPYFVVALLALSGGAARGDSGPLGIGVLVGSPMGISAKLRLGKNVALDLGAGAASIGDGGPDCHL